MDAARLTDLEFQPLVALTYGAPARLLDVQRMDDGELATQPTDQRRAPESIGVQLGATYFRGDLQALSPRA